MSAPAGDLLWGCDLVPHPEGGRYARFFTSDAATAIHYRLAAGERSRFHRLTRSHELWLHHRGPTVFLHLLAPDGSGHRVLRVGSAPGDAPAAAVPPGWWQAAELRLEGGRPAGDRNGDAESALVSCVVTPPFGWEQWELLRERLDAAPDLVRDAEIDALM